MKMSEGRKSQIIKEALECVPDLNPEKETLLTTLSFEHITSFVEWQRLSKQVRDAGVEMERLLGLANAKKIMFFAVAGSIPVVKAAIQESKGKEAVTGLSLAKIVDPTTDGQPPKKEYADEDKLIALTILKIGDDKKESLIKAMMDNIVN